MSCDALFAVQATARANSSLRNVVFLLRLLPRPVSLQVRTACMERHTQLDPIHAQNSTTQQPVSGNNAMTEAV